MKFSKKTKKLLNKFKGSDWFDKLYLTKQLKLRVYSASSSLTGCDMGDYLLFGQQEQQQTTAAAADSTHD